MNANLIQQLSCGRHHQVFIRQDLKNLNVWRRLAFGGGPPLVRAIEDAANQFGIERAKPVTICDRWFTRKHSFNRAIFYRTAIGYHAAQPFFIGHKLRNASAANAQRGLGARLVEDHRIG